MKKCLVCHIRSVETAWKHWMFQSSLACLPKCLAVHCYVLQLPKSIKEHLKSNMIKHFKKFKTKLFLHLRSFRINSLIIAAEMTQSRKTNLTIKVFEGWLYSNVCIFITFYENPYQPLLKGTPNSKNLQIFCKYA